MEKLINNTIITSNNNCVNILLFQENNRYYYDIYNLCKEKVYFIGRFLLDSFVYYLDYEINDNYLLIYHYKPIIGTNKNNITEIIKFYDLVDNISIVDSIDNILYKFNSDMLSYDNSKDNKKYDNCKKKSKIKDRSLKTLSIFEYRKYLSNLNNKNHKNMDNIINIDDYIGKKNDSKIKTKK